MAQGFSRTHRLLGQALARQFSPVSVVMRESGESPWACITFSGARHSFTFGLDGAAGWSAACGVASDLPDMEFNLPGELVADITTPLLSRDANGAVTVRVEALTVLAA